MGDLEGILDDSVLVKIPGVVPFKKIGHLCGYVMREASFSSCSFYFEKKINYSVKLLPLEKNQKEYSQCVRSGNPSLFLKGEFVCDTGKVFFEGQGELIKGENNRGFRQIYLRPDEKSPALLSLVENTIKRYFSLAHYRIL